MLSEKEERFCQEYIIDLNAAAAARRSGYSEKTAKEIGYENLTKPHIIDKISQLKQARSKRTQITADKVLKEFAKIAFSNISDFLNDDMTMKTLTSIGRKNSAAIASVKKTITTFEGGEKESIEFKLHNKITALEDVGKHIGFFKEDNEQKADALKSFQIVPASEGRSQ